MEGPLSETLARVSDNGQDLLPGYPLFNTDQGGSTEASADFDADAVFDVIAVTPTLTLATAQRDNDTTESPLAPPCGPVVVDHDVDHFIKAAFDGAGALDAQADEAGLDWSLDFHDNSDESDDEFHIDLEEDVSVSLAASSEHKTDELQSVEDEFGATIFNLRERVSPPSLSASSCHPLKSSLLTMSTNQSSGFGCCFPVQKRALCAPGGEGEVMSLEECFG